MITLSDLGLNPVAERARTGEKLNATVTGGLCWLYCRRFAEEIKESSVEGEISSAHMANFCAKASVYAFDIPPGDGSTDIPSKILSLDPEQGRVLLKDDIKVEMNDMDVGLYQLFTEFEPLMMKGLLSLRYGEIYGEMVSKGFIGSHGNEYDALVELKARCLRFIIFMTMSEMGFDNRKRIQISFSFEDNIKDWFIGHWTEEGYTIYLGDEETLAMDSVSHGLTIGNNLRVMENAAYIYVNNRTRAVSIVSQIMDIKKRNEEKAKSETEKKGRTKTETVTRICIAPSLNLNIEAITHKKPEYRSFDSTDLDLLDRIRMDRSALNTMERTARSVKFPDNDSSKAAETDRRVHESVREYVKGCGA